MELKARSPSYDTKNITTQVETNLFTLRPDQSRPSKRLQMTHMHKIKDPNLGLM